MQRWVLISLVVLSSTLLWPVNRWATRSGARPEAMGIVGSLVGIPLAILLGLALGSPLLAHRALLIGAVGGVAYAVGFVLIIFFCLRIGPTGPTVTLNNMGLVWPVLIGLLWFAPAAPAAVQWFGFGCTLLALALTGANRSRDEAVTPITARWAGWALVGWVFAGISMSCQYLDSQLAPNTPYAYLLASFTVALVICLGISIVKRIVTVHEGETQQRNSLPTHVEALAGVSVGAINVFSITLTILLLGPLHVSPAIVMPVTVAGPVILMLLIGHVILKERLNSLGWTASALGLAGVVCLSLSR